MAVGNISVDFKESGWSVHGSMRAGLSEIRRTIFRVCRISRDDVTGEIIMSEIVKLLDYLWLGYRRGIRRETFLFFHASCRVQRRFSHTIDAVRIGNQIESLGLLSSCGAVLQGAVKNEVRRPQHISKTTLWRGTF